MDPRCQPSALLKYSPHPTSTLSLKTTEFTYLVPCGGILWIDGQERDHRCLGDEGAVVLRGKPDCSEKREQNQDQLCFTGRGRKQVGAGRPDISWGGGGGEGFGS